MLNDIAGRAVPIGAPSAPARRDPTSAPTRPDLGPSQWSHLALTPPGRLPGSLEGPWPPLRPPHPPRYLEAASQRVVVFDGAMGTNLQLAELAADDFGGPELEGCNELLVVTRPDVVDRIHRSFLEVGCDVVETDTFGAFAPVLAEYGQAHRVRELNLAAAALAREAADDFSTPDRPRWVAGSIGPGTKFPTLGQIRYADLRDAYQEQAAALIEGGVDLIIIETVFDLLQAKAAINGARRAMRAAGRPPAHPGPGDHRADRHHAARAPRSAPPCAPSRPWTST